MHGSRRGHKACREIKINQDVGKILERCQKLSRRFFADYYDLGCCKAPSYFRRANLTLYLILLR